MGWSLSTFLNILALNQSWQTHAVVWTRLGLNLFPSSCHFIWDWPTLWKFTAIEENRISHLPQINFLSLPLVENFKEVPSWPAFFNALPIDQNLHSFDFQKVANWPKSSVQKVAQNSYKFGRPTIPQSKSKFKNLFPDGWLEQHLKGWTDQSKALTLNPRIGRYWPAPPFLLFINRNWSFSVFSPRSRLWTLGWSEACWQVVNKPRWHFWPRSS